MYFYQKNTGEENTRVTKDTKEKYSFQLFVYFVVRFLAPLVGFFQCGD
jgi:hypothetical protein